MAPQDPQIKRSPSSSPACACLIPCPVPSPLRFLPSKPPTAPCLHVYPLDPPSPSLRPSLARNLKLQCRRFSSPLRFAIADELFPGFFFSTNQVAKSLPLEPVVLMLVQPAATFAGPSPGTQAPPWPWPLPSGWPWSATLLLSHHPPICSTCFVDRVGSRLHCRLAGGNTPVKPAAVLPSAGV